MREFTEQEKEYMKIATRMIMFDGYIITPMPDGRTKVEPYGKDYMIAIISALVNIIEGE